MATVNLPGYKERVAILGIGLLGNALIGYAFDYGLYPYVIWKLGPLQGAALMTLVSFLVCYAMILFYDWTKKDWLGIETIKELKEYAGNSRTIRMLGWAMKKGDAMVLIFLSIWYDPFVTVAYMRQGAHQYNGMTRRDWQIFLLALIIGNGSWTLTLFTGLSAAEYAWESLFGATQ